MGLFLWIVFGTLAGLSARWLMAGPRAGGMPMAVALGIAGAVMGGLLGTFSSSEAAVGLDGRSLLMAIIGSMIVLICYRSVALRYEVDGALARSPIQ